MTTALTDSVFDSVHACWNDYGTVMREINRRISGDPGTLYRDYFHALAGRRRFENALFLGCGDGNVPRGFVEQEIVVRGIGVDASEQALAIARTATSGLPLTYQHVPDGAALPRGPFDLIVSEGALHRVGYIDRLLRDACRALSADGFLLSYDYVGPNRYQYPPDQWAACERVNRNLPQHAQRALMYPDLSEMLRHDPCATHPELVPATLTRYFAIERYREVGGAIAFPLLTFNSVISSLPPDEAERVIGEVLLEDLAWLQERPGSTLFAFSYGRPKHDVLRGTGQLRAWTTEENEREAGARRNGGHYALPAGEARR